MPTLLRYETEPKHRIVPSGNFEFPKISFEISNSSSKLPFSIWVMLIHSPEFEHIVGTKFWSLKSKTIGFFCTTGCSVQQLTQTSFAGSKLALIDWLTVTGPFWMREPWNVDSMPVWSSKVPMLGVIDVTFWPNVLSLLMLMRSAVCWWGLPYADEVCNYADEVCVMLMRSAIMLMRSAEKALCYVTMLR